MVTRIDVISGFLGAGKTTLINKILGEVGSRERVAVVENEVGDIGVDGQVLAEHGIQVREITKGCICCTLFGDFITAMVELLDNYELDRVIVEPTGVGSVSDVLKAVAEVAKKKPVRINALATVVDCTKYDMYSRTFGGFFEDQIANVAAIFLSRTTDANAISVSQVSEQLRSINAAALIVDTPWDQLSGSDVVRFAEQGELSRTMYDQALGSNTAGNSNGFSSWSVRTDAGFDSDELLERLKQLADKEAFGLILRGKGVIAGAEGRGLLFDYVPGETNVREIAHDGDGKIVMIGLSINSGNLEKLFSNF